MKTYKLGKIEVMAYDLPSQTQNEVSYLTAWEAMESPEYEDGWRIPTLEEMTYLINLSMNYKVLGINYKRPYWYSKYNYDAKTAWVVFGEGDYINQTSMYNLYPVRFVRDI